jgi:4-diphosphocytidyl-2-C-methyl-D-erythritol kinase
MPIRRNSPCKVNFVLNLLGKRPDGYHELETLFFPVPLHDVLTVDRAPAASSGATADRVLLTCDHPGLPCDGTNLVHKAATAFLAASGVPTAVSLHLEKRLPLAAGIGGGSANAAVTLLALNELFEYPLSVADLDRLAAGLGSDVNFFLQPNPALASGRGECVEPMAPFSSLRGTAMLLFHPGFGVSTPWAFKELARFPEDLNGRPGRAREVAQLFQSGDLTAAGNALFNGLENPVFEKYPILKLYTGFMRRNGAFGALMSGSGSTTFGLFPDLKTARSTAVAFREEFGAAGWLEVVAL